MAQTRRDGDAGIRRRRSEVYISIPCGLYPTLSDFIRVFLTAALKIGWQEQEFSCPSGLPEANEDYVKKLREKTILYSQARNSEDLGSEPIKRNLNIFMLFRFSEGK